jgi:hypothetical protein
MHRYLTPTRVKFAGVDPGFRHLAVASIDVDVRTMRIVSDRCVLVDAVKAQEQCTDTKCVHTKTTSSRLRHVYAKLDNIVNKAEAIYIERQPLTGMTDIEQLLFDRWRGNSVLINSRRMRKSLDCWTDDYDDRKVLALQRAEQLRRVYMDSEPPWVLGDRNHDAAEAWLYAYMAFDAWRARETHARHAKQLRVKTKRVVTDWECFRFTPKQPRFS